MRYCKKQLERGWRAVLYFSYEIDDTSEVAAFGFLEHSFTLVFAQSIFDALFAMNFGG